jgi:pyruvate,orthophosphate dikinase
MAANKTARKPATKAQASAKKPASKGPKYVYTWGAGRADGDGSMKALLGGKGANLAEMTRIGLPVPPGFTITTEVCTYFYANRKTYPQQLQASPIWSALWAPASAPPTGCPFSSPSAPAPATRCPG